MSLSPPPKVRKLQETLHAKAKSAPSYRFYALYDKMYRADVLQHAYARCKANGGAEGVDGQTFADIEAYGVEKWLGELTEELRRKTYRPQAVRRGYIPKSDGKQRPLGIPTIKDRVVQTAAGLVLEPIFEADLPAEQYGYRQGRSALEAVRHVHRLMSAGYTEVVDADLSGYFDSIPHAELMKSVARRVSDRHVLGLIKRWLEAPVEETDERGSMQRTTRHKDEGRGCPQGSPLSPLLANVYMRRFLLGWKVLGHEQRLGAYIVNFADDFVVCCRGTAAAAMAAMRGLMDKLKLTVNEAKTRICRGPDEPFDFLGYTIGRLYSSKTGRPYLGVKPSAKSLRAVKQKIHEQTVAKWSWRTTANLVQDLNRLARGWANYFCLGSVRTAHRTVECHLRQRLRRWLVRKSKVQGSGGVRYPVEYLHDTLGLLHLPCRPSQLLWA